MTHFNPDHSFFDEARIYIKEVYGINEDIVAVDGIHINLTVLVAGAMATQYYEGARDLMKDLKERDIL